MEKWHENMFAKKKKKPTSNNVAQHVINNTSTKAVGIPIVQITRPKKLWFKFLAPAPSPLKFVRRIASRDLLTIETKLLEILQINFFLFQNVIKFF